MNSNPPKNRLDKSVLSGFFSCTNRIAKRIFGSRKTQKQLATIRRRRQINLVEVFEVRAMLSTFSVTSNADSGAGTLRQALLDAAASSGADDIQFNIGSTITLGSALPGISANDTVDLNDYSVSLVGQVFTGSGTITNNASSSAATLSQNGIGTFGGVIQDSIYGTIGLTVTGGTLTLTGASTYTGATTVSGGTLKFSDRVVPSTSIVIDSGATLEYAVSTAVGNNFKQTSTTFTGGGTLRKTGTGAIFFGGGGTINWEFGAGSLIDVQSGLLVGGNFAQDVWTSNLSDLRIASGAYFAGVEANVRVNALTGGGTLSTGYSGAGYSAFTVGVNNGGGTFSGSIIDGATNVGGVPVSGGGGGAGFLNKVGSGTQTLTGTSSFTGATTISDGKLTVNGTIPNSVTVNSSGTLRGNATVSGNLSNEATVSPGNSPGIITVNGDYSQGSDGTLAMEIQGTNASTPDFDQLIVNGTVTLGGVLNVSLLSGYYPLVNDTFRIIDNDSNDAITGTFVGLPDDTLFALGGATFRIDYYGGTGNDVVLTVTASPYLLVSNTNDSGAGSLRDAVLVADGLPGINTIVFSSLFDSAQTITLTSGWLSFTDADTTTITGPGANLLSISGNNAGRVFLVESGAFAALAGMTITGGSGAFIGGGVRNDGTVTITRVTMTGNSADHGGGLGNTGTATVIDSTFSGNFGLNEGGGLENYGALTLVNSTIAGNASPRGGGIANAGGGTLNVTNSTISGNSGGGLDNIDGTVLLTNTIIAAQTLGGDINGLVSGANNLIGTGGSGGLVNGMNGNIVGVSDPKLSALADYGGQTQTMALLPASPAINAGDWDGAPSTDQRGRPRFGNTDIGAFEYQFKVTSTADSGNGSLRQAIINANATIGTDTVVFKVGSGATTISPMSGLPTITDKIVIDGTTQPGFVGTPLIQIDGTSAGDADGLQLGVSPDVSSSDGSTVKGLIISNFSTIARFGIVLDSSNNIIQGNWIGLDSAGTAAAPNFHGILLGTGNLIGTNGDGVNDTVERNVISGNLQHGVLGNGGSNSRIAGNYIGTNAVGDAPLDNEFSNIFMQSTSGNIIGTDGSNDAFNANERNVINGEILVADDTVIAGNFIGLNADGTAALPGVNNVGIQFGDATSGARIGTNSDGIADAEERNVISGLNGPGIISSGNNDLVIAGNYIGIDITGTLAIPNEYGIELVTSNTGVRIGTNADGVHDAAERNVISGNIIGIRINGVGASNNIVAGNYIGTDSVGTSSVSNSIGVLIDGGASNNTVGGNTTSARNIISGNTAYGICIDQANTNSNIVEGNFIGTDVSGDLALGNLFDGVYITGGAKNNTIGGTTFASRNVISGNVLSGVLVDGDGTDDNRISSNYIGVNSLGVFAVPNGNTGILVTGGPENTIIGGTAAGAGNTISGNSAEGVLIENLVLGLSTTGTRVEGNLIGTNASGTATIPNAAGVVIAGGTSSIIGGTASVARNIISGNTGDGILVRDAASFGNTIAGNFIGTDVTGNAGLANLLSGIYLEDGTGTMIGGFTTIPGTGAGNVISGNAGRGILDGFNATATLVLGNLIGLGADGVTDLGNGNAGIQVNGLNTLIGGDDDDDGSLDGGVRSRNVISGNTTQGINIGHSGSARNTIIRGNYVGTTRDGSSAVANLSGGINVGSAPGTFVGGDTQGAGNLVSGNGSAGISINAISHPEIGGLYNAVVQGNTVGLNAAGTLSLSNSIGISVANADNLIGGTTAGARNTISGNTSVGISVVLASASQNTIAGNYIGTNAAGMAAIANGVGVRFSDGAHDNILGGTQAAARNIISGNSSRGISIEKASGNVVQGNFIGTDYTGLLPMANQGVGIEIRGFNNAPENEAHDNVIGGKSPGAGNVVSGNGDGISLDGNGVYNTTVAGNLIGLGSDGSTIVANGTGILFANSYNNTIGGLTTAARNIISGNTSYGILLNYDAYDNTILGNFIGTDSTGTVAKPNSSGLLVIGPGNTIGGSTAGARNIISGNTGFGVQLDAPSNFVIGNYIGTNAAGTARLANDVGIAIESGGSSNQIGTNGDGVTDVGERNVISGNSLYNVFINGGNNNRVAGNYIGTNAAGTSSVGNGEGVVIVNATGNVIGTDGSADGFNANERNIISGHSGRAVILEGSNTVAGNYIGLDVTGTASISNDDGIQVTETGARVGTNSDGVADDEERNVISGSYYDGIIVRNADTTAVVIAGNYIGTNASGNLPLPNTRNGISIILGAHDNTIGGTANAARNVISGNTQSGVLIDGAGSDNNVLLGNYIGTDVSGAMTLGNTQGITLSAGATNNTIGGASVGASNVIAYNTLGGLRLEDGLSASNLLVNNAYFGNLGLAIDAGPIGRTLNDAPEVDGVLNFPVVTSSQIVGNEIIVDGTMPDGKTVELYISAPTADGVGQGRQRLASVLDNSLADENAAAGQFRVRILLGNGVNHGTPLTALTIGSTSEFSPIVFAGEVGSSLAPQITLAATTVTLTTGNAISVDGSFYDPDSVSWEATVNYGDGTGLQPLTLNTDNTFRLQHTYTSIGSFVVSVQIRDTTLISSTATLGVIVQNEAPTATFNKFTITSPANEGQLVTLTGRFEDTAGTHTATIEWGDGQSSSVPILPGARQFTATHVYVDDVNAAGTSTPSDVYRVTVTITDDAGATDSTPVGLFLEEIRNVLPSALYAGFSSTSISEGQSVTMNSLLFIDPGMQDIHSLKVNWGDGQESHITLPLGVRSLAGLTSEHLAQLTHVYTDDSSIGPDEYTITVEVADDDEPQLATSLTQVISVANAVPVVATAYVTPPGILENGEVVLMGSVYDPGQFDSHVVSVNWGDGSSETTFGLDAGINSWPAGLSHRYLNNAPEGRDYFITIRVSDNDSPRLYGTMTVAVAVQNVAPVVQSLVLSSGSDAILEGQSVTLTGSYTDASPIDSHTVMVHWGDETSSPATVDPVTRTFTATHRYRDNNTDLEQISIDTNGNIVVTYQAYEISVIVTDQDGDSATAHTSQNVLNVAPTVSIEPASGNDPELINLVSSVFDPGELDTFEYRWIAEVVGIMGLEPQFGSAPTFLVDRSAAPEALWRVQLEVTDDDRGLGSYATTLLVGTNGDDMGVNRLTVTDTMFSQAGTTNLMALALDGADTIDASGVTNPYFSVTLVGGGGLDNLYGGAGNDVYVLAQGNDNANVASDDVITPVETGNDRYLLKPNSMLTVIDRSGSNSLDFSLGDFGDSSGITFDLDTANSITLTSQDVSLSQPAGHFVQTLGTFTGLVGSRFGDLLTGASGATVSGGAGNDQLTAKTGTTNATFFGGDHDDVLTISALTTEISGLNFSGDDGIDTLINLGFVTGLTFGGGADDDILQNIGTVLGTLNFGGDDGVDALFNTGSIGALVFNGGADDDIFVNNGSTVTDLNFNGDDDVLLEGAGTIETLTFGGDDGADIFANLGIITTLTFNGGADDDIFVNNGTAVSTLNFGGDDDVLLEGAGEIGTLNFGGDDGVDALFNTGRIDTLIFNGGADDDIFVNNGTTLTDLSFGGDDDILLEGAGEIGTLTFNGGADDDIFVNLGSIADLTFRGGADDDIFVNNGTAVSTLNFGGDEDVLLAGAGEIGSLTFGGDDGVDALFNTGSIGTLVFNGGADDDIFVNNGSVLTDLSFNGDDNILLEGVGAIGTLTFDGDEGADSFVNLGSITTLTFSGGADDDLLVNSGTTVSGLNLGGDEDVLLEGAGTIGA